MKDADAVDFDVESIRPHVIMGMNFPVRCRSSIRVQLPHMNQLSVSRESKIDVHLSRSCVYGSTFAYCDLYVFATRSHRSTNFICK